MFIDALLLLSDAQAVTADAYSTNTLDLGNVTPKRQVGSGEPLEVVVAVDVAADFTTGDETYAFLLVQSANADLSSHETIATYTILAATLVAGYIFRIPIPPGFPTLRYLGLRFDVGGTSPTITVTAAVQPTSMASLRVPVAYADAITIS